MSKVLERLRRNIDTHRERYGRWAVIAILCFLALQALDWWQTTDFLVGKRKGLAKVAKESLEVIASPWLRWPLLVVGTVGVIALHFYDRHQRERTSEPPNLQALNFNQLSGANHDLQPKIGQMQSVTKPIPFDTPLDADLGIMLEREQFHPFQYKAIIAEVQVSIRNRTDKPKYLMHFKWEMDGPLNKDWQDIEVQRERYTLELRRQRLPGTLGPWESVRGWLVTALPHQPSGGVAGYTLSLEDEIGTQYSIRRDRRGGRITGQAERGHS